MPRCGILSGELLPPDVPRCGVLSGELLLPPDMCRCGVLSGELLPPDVPRCGLLTDDGVADGAQLLPLVVISARPPTVILVAT